MENGFRELYQQIILDHNRSPRNYGKLENATHRIEGQNPLCGDHYVIYLQLEGDEIKDIRFEGKGCAISKSSASVMSEVVKGKKISEVDRYFELFHQLVTGALEGADGFKDLGKLAAFSGVAEFPIRVKCATLPWHTLHNALHGRSETVSTEEKS